MALSPAASYGPRDLADLAAGLAALPVSTVIRLGTQSISLNASSQFVITGGVVTSNLIATGGTANGVIIGGGTPAAGTFSTLIGVTALYLGTNTAGAAFTFNGPAGTNRTMTFQTASSGRWQIGITGAAESGSNAGSDFFISRFSDAGATIDNPIFVTRSTGIVAINTLSVANNMLKSSATGLTAAGTTLATALALTKDISVVTTVASGSGVTLPAAGIGEDVLIVNRGANALLVYPPTSSGIINALAAGGAYSIASLSFQRFVQVSTTQFYSA